MPAMTGWQFRAAQQALADRELAGVPVVIISAVINCEHDGLPLGVAGVVPKPITAIISWRSQQPETARTV
jgi:hypothetical protein